MFSLLGERNVIRRVGKPLLLLRGGSAVKNSPAVQDMQETQVWSLGQEDALEEEMATHSSIFAHGWGESPRFLPLLLRLSD